MRAEIRRLHTPEARCLEEFVPEDPTDFSLLVQIIAGPAGQEGEESFDLEVIALKTAAARVEADGPLLGGHLLLVNRFNAGEVRSWIERAVTSLEGKEWKELAHKIGRIGRWEFEDYRER